MKDCIKAPKAKQIFDLVLSRVNSREQLFQQTRLIWFVKALHLSNRAHVRRLIGSKLWAVILQFACNSPPIEPHLITKTTLSLCLFLKPCFGGVTSRRSNLFQFSEILKI